MRRIYLASNSKARKKLLKLLGLKFKVLPSGVKEKRFCSDANYARLVKRNALLKATEVAKKVKGGIIIAADTILVVGKKIFGKPKNLKVAELTLKTLSRRPQWVYTGLAVIDKDKNKTLVSYEKTKVYMDKLNPQEIHAYFRKISPLDKAGSFDIQGKGALFIRRIEGCFYNVVGLPLRRLYLMLKKLNIKILLSILLCSFLAGCYTEYNIVTQQEEFYYYSTDKEIQIGQAIAKEVEKEYKLVDDPLVQKRVEDIGKKIVAVCDRKEIDYTFKVLDDDEVNAFALPGGFIYVNRGTIEKVSSDDELAAILGHEVAHVVARHSIKKLQALQAYSLLRMLTLAVPQGQDVGTAADLAFTQILLGYGRDDELLADQLGVRYAKLAGFRPQAMIDFLQRLQEINRRKPLRAKSYFKTHPYVPDRIRIIKEELGEKINFSDYINIEEKKGL
ncbi:MAG: Maf family nucleotide pyrophosphatase [Candidatus Omnitrophica bacterium]|nr:Maf family nucleotide pyrophosphatase [Candidatus Omnitrophota bacterium]